MNNPTYPPLTPRQLSEDARLRAAHRRAAPLFRAQLLSTEVPDAIVIEYVRPPLAIALERHPVLLETPTDARRSTHRLALEPTPGGLVLRHIVEPE